MKEQILSYLENVEKGLDQMEIASGLDLKSVEDYQELKKSLDLLVSTGKLHCSKHNRYSLMRNCSSLRTGYIKINKSGNGFVLNEDGPDYFVPRENLNGAVEDDLVEIDVQSGDGIVTNILKRDLSTLVGEIVVKNNNKVFELDNKKKKINIKITEESMSHCVEGHKVLVKIIKELKNNLYLGEITKILGHKNDPGVDILAIACKHNIELDFSEAVKEEVAKLPTYVQEEDLKNRRDLRGDIIFTIDGDDTKDIDDAISIRKGNDNYILGVHIADVSHYVTEHTKLFEAAFTRGTSSYLADTVLPQLPHELSNGICSLNEGEDRLTISCEMVINSKGKIIDHDIFQSVICSKKKMTYKNVNKILNNEEIPEGYEQFSDRLYLMKELSDVLRNQMIANGYSDFGVGEGKIIQDEEGKAIDVIKRVQGEGENIIENFMIAANETVAKHVTDMGLPFLYRIHGTPRPEKVEDFTNLLKVLGYKLDVNLNEITPHTMQKLIKSLEGSDKAEILSSMLIRSLPKAVYSDVNIGHFGLGSRIYTHFTSPIRRLCDLVVGQMLHEYIFDGKIDADTINKFEKILPTMAEQASKKEQDAAEAERETFDMKAAELMESKIGEEYDAQITGVTEFGLFVQLDNYIEGLVHISSMPGVYTYNSDILSLVSNSKRYTMGDIIKVKCVSASKEAGTIDFEIVGNCKNKMEESFPARTRKKKH